MLHFRQIPMEIHHVEKDSCSWAADHYRNYGAAGMCANADAAAKTETATLAECGLEPCRFVFVLESVSPLTPHGLGAYITVLKTADQVPTKPAGRCGSGPQVIPILIPMMGSEGDGGAFGPMKSTLCHR